MKKIIMSLMVLFLLVGFVSNPVLALDRCGGHCSGCPSQGDCGGDGDGCGDCDSECNGNCSDCDNDCGGSDNDCDGDSCTI